MARTILFPIDLNSPEGCRHSLAEALRLLDKGGVLHIVAVLPQFGLPLVSGYFGRDYEKDALRALGQELTHWVNENVPNNISVRPRVLHGTIYDEILRAADSVQAELIVIGAHRPELSDYLLGPNAARVVRHARQSVYVVRPPIESSASDKT